MSYSDDGGATWVSQFQVNNPIQRSQGAEVTIGPNGEVYITWAGVIPNSPFTEDFVGFVEINQWRTKLDCNGKRIRYKRYSGYPFRKEQYKGKRTS
jgi:hypothetical protein